MRNSEAEQRWARRFERAGEMLDALGEGGGCKKLEGGVVESVRILLPGPDRGDTLIVVKASTAMGKYVGFVGGPDIVTALLTWRAKERGPGVKYREDVPYPKR